MGEEIQGVGEDTWWRKAIPEARDRLQSRVLVVSVGTLLAGLSAYSLSVAYPSAVRTALPVEAVGISVGFALLVRALRAATTGGAACGGMICFLITLWTGSFIESALRTGLTPLILLFVLTFVSTRAGRTRKVAKEACREQARKKCRTGDCESFGGGSERYSLLSKPGGSMGGLLLHLGTPWCLGI